jgi:hypothetical protein
MQNRKSTIALCMLISMAAASEGRAQMLKWEDHGYLTVNGGAQVGSQTFDETATPTIYGEAASIQTPHTIDGGALFDLSGGVRVAGNLGVGVAYSYFSTSESPTVTAQIPNPLFYSRPRTATASAGSLEHTESVVHIQALWMLPASHKMDVAFTAGPSIFSVSQDMVSEDITNGLVEGAPPYSSVTLSSVPVVRQKKTATGFNVGADVTYMVVRQFGVGVSLRYAAASVDLPTAGGGEVSVDVGGFQIGGGVRVRF